MGFSSHLRETLREFPFEENGAYTLNHSQCKAISAYFVSTLERFFGTILRPPSWSNTSSSSRLSRSSATNPLPIRGWNSFSVFSENKVLKLWSSRKNQSSSAALSDEYNISGIIEELRNAPYAVEELYRVVKEAQQYLQTCSNVEWWKSALLLGNVNEVRDIHIHDLMWCIVGLNLALYTVRGVDLVSRSQFTRLHIAKCYAEMTIFSSRGSDIIQCEQEDREELLPSLLKVKQKYDEMNFVRKRVMNPPEKIKYEIVQFLARKLKGNPRVETGFSTYVSKPPEDMQIDIEDLVFLSQHHKVNPDKSGAIHEASWLGTKVRLKEFDYNTSKEAFNHEFGVLIATHCPFIIQLYGWSINMQDHVCYLVQEFVNNNLESLVAEKRSMKKTLHLPVVVDLMLQLSRAMEYLHSHNLVHGNLCPSNVLIEPLRSSPELMERGYGRVKLSNFTPGRLIGDISHAKSLLYRAPEVWPQTPINHPTCSFESDVYSFAMCIAYSLTGEEPFEGIISKPTMKQMIEEGKVPILPSHCPVVLRDLLMKCWSTDPLSRPSFATITMTLRHLKVLMMKMKALDQLSGTSMQNEYSLATPMITYTELLEATREFSDRVKNIAMFSMYHGVLSDGSKVLVQSIRDIMNTKWMWIKVSQLLQLRQGNILSLRAVSCYGSECWFVYEEKTSIQGSLDSWLVEGIYTLEKPALDITACWKIAVGVACGLQYLHTQDVIFMITPENILLDENNEPKIIVDSVLIEGSVMDTDLENQRCIGVMHFGTLLAKLLSHLGHYSSKENLDEGSSNRASDNQVLILAELESLCTGAALRMDEVVEMLEVYDTYAEDAALYEESNEMES